MAEHGWAREAGGRVSSVKEPWRRQPPRAETDVIARLAAGDVRALEELYDRHAAALYGMLGRLVPDRRDREEILQETFVAVWRHADTYDGRRGSVHTWLFAIAHRKAIDRLRAQRSRPAETPTDPLVTVPVGQETEVDGLYRADPTADGAQASEQREAVMRALMGLPAEQRDVVVMAYLLGYSSTEIAELRRLPVGTVKSRMQRALARLRRLLGPEEAGP